MNERSRYVAVGAAVGAVLGAVLGFGYARLAGDQDDSSEGGHGIVPGRELRPIDSGILFRLGVTVIGLIRQIADLA